MIYKSSIANKLQQDDKDILIMLLPQIAKEAAKKHNNVKQLLNAIESDSLRAKVIKIFQAHKINFK